MLRGCAARVLRALRSETCPPAGNLRPALRSFSSEQDPTLLSPSWSEDFRLLFHQFMKKCDNGSWTFISQQDITDFQYRAYRSIQDSELMKGRQVSPALVLIRSFQNGLGFDHALFYNKDERRMVCLFQGGPLLQGFPGFLHGGATVTMVDSVISWLASDISEFTMTLTLNVTYKRPITIGSVVVINCQVDKIEGKKVLLSGTVRSADEKTLHAEATSLCIKLDPEKHLTLKSFQQIPHHPE